MSHDLIDTLLSVAGLAGSGIGFLVLLILGRRDKSHDEVQKIRDDVDDLQENCADIRGRLKLERWTHD